MGVMPCVILLNLVFIMNKVKNPLVSIIIPTYNRAHLIGETLDSVLAQTYTNWECIVVDDGSTDQTDVEMGKYCEIDSRIKYYKRPDDHLAGGNGARNYGFKKSNGKYIQWFDSDDLMVPEKIELKVKTMLENDVDFVVSQTKYFNNEAKNTYNYPYTSKEINFLNYAVTALNWFTPDFMADKRILKNLTFNENLKSGQEYNFFCRLLLATNNGYKLDVFLTQRRDTDNSIGNNRRKTQQKFLSSRFNTYWFNYLDLKDKAKSEIFDKHTLNVCISCFFQSNKAFSLPTYFNRNVMKVFNLKSIYFFLALISEKFFGKYHFFYKKLK